MIQRLLNKFYESSSQIQNSEMFASLTHGASVAFLLQISHVGLTYIAQVLFARWMGTNEYGAYSYSFTWAYLLATFSGIGLNSGVLRFIPQYFVENDWRTLRGLIYRSRQLTFASGVVLATFGTIVVLFLIPAEGNITTFILALWLVPFLASLNLHVEIIRGTEHIALAYFTTMLLQPILSVGFAFLLLRVFGSLTSVLTMSAIYLAILLSIAAQVWSIVLVLPKGIGQIPPAYETFEWLHVSFPLLLITGFQIILNKTDILMVGMFIGQKQAGMYNIAAKTATLGTFILTAVNAIVAPMISSIYAKGDFASLQRLISVATRWIIWFSLFVSIGLLVFGKPILGIFGRDFIIGYPALAVLVIGQLINACAGPVGYLMSLTGNQKSSAIVFGWSAAINIILNATLIPLFGNIGAALATMVTMVLWNIWLCILVKKHLGINTFIFIAKKN